MILLLLERKGRKKMITKTQFKKKIKQLIYESVEVIRDNAINLYECGGVDPEDFSNDFELPKIILHVVLQNRADDCTPLTKEGKATANNLKHF